jgi:hypothetical protein
MKRLAMAFMLLTSFRCGILTTMGTLKCLTLNLLGAGQEPF